MRRSDWIHSVTWFELVNTVCLLGFAVYVLVPTHPLVAFFEDHGVATLYLLIAGLLVALGLISLAVRRGFGQREPWGWWFALVGDLLIGDLRFSFFRVATRGHRLVISHRFHVSAYLRRPTELLAGYLDRSSSEVTFDSFA